MDRLNQVRIAALSPVDAVELMREVRETRYGQ